MPALSSAAVAAWADLAGVPGPFIAVAAVVVLAAVLSLLQALGLVRRPVWSPPAHRPPDAAAAPRRTVPHDER